MKNCDSSFLYFNFLLFILNYLIKYNNCLYPETNKDGDLFFSNIDNTKMNRIYFIAAKYFTDKTINKYIKKQGFNLQKDTSVKFRRDDDKINKNLFEPNQFSDYEEIYSNGIATSSLIYRLPVSELKNNDYILYHIFYVVNINLANPLKIFFSNDNRTFSPFFFNIVITDYLLISITIKLNNEEKYDININGDDFSNTFESIKYIKISCCNDDATSCGDNFGIAMHWTFLYIPLLDDNTPGIYTYNGLNICNIDTNPCVEGYMCRGGSCMNCDY